MPVFLKKIIIPFFCFLAGNSGAQIIVGFDIAKTPEECHKGSATLNITGIDANDTVIVKWSTGDVNVYSLNNLDEGNYSISISIKSKLDTTLNFGIDKELCKISVSNQFTPNGDGYNDFLQVGQVEKHPNFEFEIYNRWGQKIHAQKTNYIPWDGKWAGLDVPDGTYYYIFFYDTSNKHKLEKGSITILR